MSSIVSEEVDKIENEIRIAQEKQDKTRVVVLKRKLKKVLINNHQNFSGEMPTKDALNPLEFSKCDVKGVDIYIGASRPALFSAHLLKSELNIVGILNVTQEVPFSQTTLACKNLMLHQISIADRPSEDIEKHFKTAFNFIDSCIAKCKTEKGLPRKKSGVFVHCKRGISRSATFVMAYAIFKGVTLERIVHDIMQSRPQVKPNVGFWKVLCDYELKQLGRSTVSLDYFSQKNNHSSNTVEKRLVEIEKAKNNLTFEPTYVPHAKKYVCNNRISDSSRDNGIITKIVHFVRHGEGHHNLLAKKIGRKAYMDPSVFDPELTDTGKLQAAALQDDILDLCLNDKHSIDCIVFSPMQRALMTGVIACKKLFSNCLKKDLPKMIVLECVRERYGVHICDSRRTIDIIEQEYPGIDFTKIKNIEDKLHDENIRETHEHLIERGYEFMDWLKNQDEGIKSVLVFSHSSYLMNMFNAVLKFEQTDEEHNDYGTILMLKKWFNTGEMKSVKVEFVNKSVK